MFFKVFLLFAVAGYAKCCISLQGIFDILNPPIFGRSGAFGECTAFEVLSEICPGGTDGYSLEEIHNCRETIKNSQLPFEITDGNEFAKMDDNGDGLLNLDEFNKFVGC
eukprot:TRINITY_DN28178_c0_g1_i1.p1 TRINITY_DN28178_c0_g1~~TRINITY_DN28178_c0_g1_i1.p1  ORF type:complete len:109 (-),score=27.42 TRINITY_DN28178_c0_g1_i1:105-431(-)